MNEVGSMCLYSGGEDGRDNFDVCIGEGDWTAVGDVRWILIFLM